MYNEFDYMFSQEDIQPIPQRVNPQNIPTNIVKQPPCKAGYITSIPNANNGKDYFCNIDYTVRECRPYLDLLMILQQATENDTITLNIYTYGGSVNTGCFIINPMLNTKAHVRTIAYGICASIGAMIWVCGKERIATKNATIMFHMPSGGAFGKVADNAEQSTHVQQYFAWFMSTVAKDVVTADEFDQIINCRTDIFIPGDKIMARLNGLNTTTSTPIQEQPQEQQQPEEYQQPQSEDVPITEQPSASQEVNND
jgi:hypothetical protein